MSTAMSLSVDANAAASFVIRPVAARSASATISPPSSPARRFEKHCEEEFEELARNDFPSLIRLIYGELAGDRVMLSFALEALHLVGDPSRTVPFLIGFLQHPEPIVREGAILGLQPYLESSRLARDMMKGLRDNDPSDGVRRAAADAVLLLDP